MSERRTCNGGGYLTAAVSFSINQNRSIGHSDNLAAVLRTFVSSRAEREVVDGIGGGKTLLRHNALGVILDDRLIDVLDLGRLDLGGLLAVIKLKTDADGFILISRKLDITSIL